MVAAGPVTNFVGGIALATLLLCYRQLNVHWRYLIWLSAAYNLFNAAGYLLLGTLSGIGDWGFLIEAWQIGGPQRAALAFFSALLYYVFMCVIAFAGNFGRERMRRVAVVPYFAAGATACAAAAVSAQGLALVAVAAAASFGAGFGLLVIGDWNWATAPKDERLVVRSPRWIVASLVATTFYIAVVGRGLSV